MNICRNILLLLIVLAGAVLPANAQLTAADAFVNAPRNVFPLLDKTTRLDMIDYYNSGSATPSTNQMQGKSRITEMTPGSIKISMTDASSYQLALLPAGNDTVIALISTVATPAPDSNLAFYTSDWTAMTAADIFSKPTLKEWLTNGGKPDDVEGLVPFLLVSYDYNPQTTILTLTNNTKQFLSDDVYDIVGSYLLPQINYKWDGKKMILKK